VRRTVSREFKWARELGADTSASEMTVADQRGDVVRGESVVLAKRKRLLYLFMKDLSSGVSGEMLSTKYHLCGLIEGPAFGGGCVCSTKGVGLALGGIAERWSALLCLPLRHEPNSPSAVSLVPLLCHVVLVRSDTC
jgi:hypothetical protein